MAFDRNRPIYDIPMGGENWRALMGLDGEPWLKEGLTTNQKTAILREAAEANNPKAIKEMLRIISEQIKLVESVDNTNTSVFLKEVPTKNIRANLQEIESFHKDFLKEYEPRYVPKKSIWKSIKDKTTPFLKSASRALPPLTLYAEAALSPNSVAETMRQAEEDNKDWEEFKGRISSIWE